MRNRHLPAVAVLALMLAGLPSCVVNEPSKRTPRRDGRLDAAPSTEPPAPEPRIDRSPGLDPRPEAGPEAGPGDGGAQPPAREGCYSQHTGWGDCHDGSPDFPWCLRARERFGDLPRCRSQNDGDIGCRSEICEVDCGGFACVGLPTCDGCDGSLCGIYDNPFVCRGGQWVGVGDFGWHEDSQPPQPIVDMSPDLSLDAAE